MADRFQQQMQTLQEHAQSAQRIASVAFALAGSALLLFVLVGWLMLGYYRRELYAVQSELQRHEQAIPILEAYAASDAALCDRRLCVNTDAAAPAYGEKRQYRPAKPRQ